MKRTPRYKQRRIKKTRPNKFAAINAVLLLILIYLLTTYITHIPALQYHSISIETTQDNEYLKHQANLIATNYLNEHTKHTLKPQTTNIIFSNLKQLENSLIQIPEIDDIKIKKRHTKTPIIEIKPKNISNIICDKTQCFYITDDNIASRPAPIPEPGYNTFRISIQNIIINTGDQIDNNYIKRTSNINSILAKNNITPYEIEFITTNIIKIHTIKVGNRTLNKPLTILIDYSKTDDTIPKNIHNIAIIVQDTQKPFKQIDARIKDRIYYKQYEQ